MRHVPNLRYTARGRPQSMHRRIVRVENFGGRLAAAIFDLLAMVSFRRRPTSPTVLGKKLNRYAAAPPSSPSVFFIGSPIARNNARASSSVRAEVTNVMFIPCGRDNLSGLISGKTICSESPRL